MTVFMWLCLVLLINPGEALALMLILAAPPVYVYFAVKEFRSLQNNFQSALKSFKERQHDMKNFLFKLEMETREMGLDNATVLSLIVSWGLLFTGIMVWLILGWFLLSKRSGQSASIENQLGKLVTAGMTAYAGISKLRNQVKQTENKLVASKEKFESYLQESTTSLNTKINRTMEFTRSGVRAIGSIMQNEKQGSPVSPRG